MGFIKLKDIQWLQIVFGDSFAISLHWMSDCYCKMSKNVICKQMLLKRTSFTILSKFSITIAPACVKNRCIKLSRKGVLAEKPQA